MKKLLALGTALSALLVAAPAIAAPICSGSFAFDRNRVSETTINEYNLNMLQQKGVDATRAEIWSGCIRAYVRQPDGTEQMEFYEPLTFQRVG
jgi:hypothetical protein